MSAEVDEPGDASQCAAFTGEERELLFRRLVHEYGHALHYFVLRRVGNETDAADIAQQAFVAAAAGLRTFRGEAGVSTWIFGIATNLARNFLNRAPHRRHLFESADVLDEFEAPETDPCEALSRRQTLTLVASAINDLPSCMAQALLLVCVDGASYEEAARQLGVPVGTVRSRISRARGSIRERLREAGCDSAF